jgi:cell division protein FtsB
MKCYHILIIVYAGFILSSFLILFFGDEGYLSYHLLKEHREILLHNINDLQQKNMQLQQKIALLRTNPEVIRVLARKLGYYEEDENVIFIKGDLTLNEHYEIGNIIKEMKNRPERNLVLRIIGFSASIFFGVLFILLKQRKYHGHS